VSIVDDPYHDNGGLDGDPFSLILLVLTSRRDNARGPSTNIIPTTAGWVMTGLGEIKISL